MHASSRSTNLNACASHRPWTPPGDTLTLTRRATGPPRRLRHQAADNGLEVSMGCTGWWRTCVFGIVAVAAAVPLSGAEESPEAAVATPRLPEVTVTAEELESEGPFLPEVSGARVLSGKKTT